MHLVGLYTYYIQYRVYLLSLTLPPKLSRDVAEDAGSLRDKV